MTTENPDANGSEQAETGDERVQATPPPEGMGAGTETGQGGPQSIVPTEDAPSSGGRPQRAPHLDTTTRDVVTDAPAPERAMVTRAQTLPSMRLGSSRWRDPCRPRSHPE